MASISSPEAATPLAPEARRDAYLERGKAHLASDRFHAAAVEFLAAHAIDPRSFWAPHLVGIAYEKSGSLEEAVQFFERGLANADSPVSRRYALNSLQGVLARLGRVDEAARFAEQMAADDPTDAEARSIRDALIAKRDPPPEPAPTRAPERGAEGPRVWFVAPSRDRDLSPEDLPLPPRELRDWSEHDEDYLAVGKLEVEAMLSLLAAHGFDWATCGDALVLHAGDGRRLRWLAPYATERAIWGLEPERTRAHYLLGAMGEHLRVSASRDAPHLPFRDASLGLVDASAAFSHLGLAHGAWWLELARVLAPGGRLYLRVLDERALARLMAGGFAPWIGWLPPESHAVMATAGPLDFASIETVSGPRSSVDFHAEHRLRRLARGTFTIRAIEAEPRGVASVYLLERT